MKYNLDGCEIEFYKMTRNLFLLLFFIVVSSSQSGLSDSKFLTSSTMTTSIKNSEFPVEEFEAKIVATFVANILGTTQKILKILGSRLREGCDTAAGILGFLFRGTAGILNVGARGLGEVSWILRQPSSPNSAMPHAIDYLIRRIGEYLKVVVKVLKGVGETCIWAGETVEMLTNGKSSYSIIPFF